MKLEQGDYLEVNSKDTIRQLLPNYEIIWGKYIGNDGSGKMIYIEGLTGEENINRIKFSEHFYTCMESIICMKYLSDSIKPIDIQVHSDYINLINSFMAFHAHAGRVRDNACNILSLYFKKERVVELIVQLEEIFNQRHQVLHGKKIPFRLVEGIPVFMQPMGKDFNPEKWNSSMNWAEFNNSPLACIDEYMKSTINEISKAYNNIIGNLIEPIFEFIETKKINIEDVNKSPISTSSIGNQGPA